MKSTPIEKAYIEPLRRQWGEMIRVVDQTPTSATMEVRAPFTLAMAIGSVIKRFWDSGVSFDEFIIKPRDLRLTVKIAENAQMNRMRITFV